MIKSGIYRIYNTESHKNYVGSTGSNMGFDKRWYLHKWLLRNNRHPNTYLQNAWNKYGESSFEFIIIEECSNDMLIVREQAWINYYKSNDRTTGYNQKEAGSHGNHSEETKLKMSRAMMGNKNGLGYKISEEHKRILSKIHKGKIVSEESRLKMSKSQTGHIVSEVTRKKLSKITSERNKGNKYNLGRKMSESSKLKISDAKKGNKYFLGNKHTEEAKLRMSEAHKGRIFSAETKLKLSLARKQYWANKKLTTTLPVKE